ncbi:MAG: CoA pyrophosphatase [Deltaproteobacteria bacterium]|nr:CoA pyrophosphatase [Deltaproteobacteria bacterium]MBI3294750.1 CoA pyrophosphatase [Deltaproteobacteria bacterium]
MTTLNALDKVRALRTQIEGNLLSTTGAVSGQTAILIPVDPFLRSEPVLVLTKRTHTVDTHKGQVSFPGGYFEETDADLLETALREFEEEVGGKRSAIEVIGRLPTGYTRNQVPIIPWLGIVQNPLEYRPNPSEVDRLLLLPLGRLIEEGLQSVQIAFPQFRITSPGIHVDGELIWGATARILSNLRDLLKGE